MTDLQIRYFLTAARTLNFTEAAKQLFISQPALSQQIAALESELNMQLFVRYKKKVHLTPAALVLLKELPKYEKHYADIMKAAHMANEGVSQVLKIGFMEGQTMSKEWIDKYFSFRERYPDVGIELRSYSLGDLNAALMEKEVDLAYLPDFEVQEKGTVLSVDVAEDVGVAIVSKFHPLAKEHVTSMKQLKNETILMLRESESPVLYNLLQSDCKKCGFIPNIKFVSSLDENILYTEMGMGVGITNADGYAIYNPNIVPLWDLPISVRKFVFAWQRENMNTAIPLFVNWIVKEKA